MEFLPLTGNGAERSQIEAQQRSAGLRVGDVSRYWHNVITHQLTGQDALQIISEDDKEFFTVAEISSLITKQQAESEDWFIDFEEGN